MGVSATTTGDAVGSIVALGRKVGESEVAGGNEYLFVGLAVTGRAVGVMYSMDIDMLMLMLLSHPILMPLS